MQISLTEAGNKLKGLLTLRYVHLSRIRPPIHPDGALARLSFCHCGLRFAIWQLTKYKVGWLQLNEREPPHPMEHRHTLVGMGQQILFEELPPTLTVCSCSKNIVTWFLYLVAVRRALARTRAGEHGMPWPDCYLTAEHFFLDCSTQAMSFPPIPLPPPTRFPWRQCNKFPATFRVALSGSHCGTSLFCFLFVLCTCVIVVVVLLCSVCPDVVGADATMGCRCRCCFCC